MSHGLMTPGPRGALCTQIPGPGHTRDCAGTHLIPPVARVRSRSSQPAGPPPPAPRTQGLRTGSRAHRCLTNALGIKTTSAWSHFDEESWQLPPALVGTSKSQGPRFRALPRDFGVSPACSPARSARLFGPCRPLTRPSPFSHPQELVNLLLTGKASSNTFNDVVELDSGHGDVTLLKGVAARSDVGFLSLFEHYNVCQVPRRSSSASPTEGSGRSAASPPPPAGAVCRGRRLETNFSCDRGSGRRTLSSVCVCVCIGAEEGSSPGTRNLK